MGRSVDEGDDMLRRTKESYHKTILARNAKCCIKQMAKYAGNLRIKDVAVFDWNCLFIVNPQDRISPGEYGTRRNEINILWVTPSIRFSWGFFCAPFLAIHTSADLASRIVEEFRAVSGFFDMFILVVWAVESPSFGPQLAWSSFNSAGSMFDRKERRGV